MNFHIFTFIIIIVIFIITTIIFIITVKCGRSEINTTNEMSENVVQPGIEPGSPDYRSDALTTRPLNQPRMLRLVLRPYSG